MTLIELGCYSFFVFSCLVIFAYALPTHANPVGFLDPTLNFERENELHFNINGETKTLLLPSPKQFYTEIQQLGRNTFLTNITDTQSSFMYLATSTQNSAMNPSLFTNDKFVGYNALSGSPSIESAFVDGTDSVICPSTFMDQKFALAYNDDTERGMSKVSIGIEGGFTGGSTEFGLESASESSKESLSVKLKLFLRKDTKVSSLPFGKVIELKKDALDLFYNDTERFIMKYGTHAIGSKTYGCISTLEGEYIFGSMEDKHDFAVKVGASGTSGEFSVSASIGIENAASSGKERSDLVVSLKGDISDISPEGGQFNNLTAWAVALQTQFSKQCDQYAKENKVTVKSVGTFPWSELLHSSAMPPFSIESMTNIAMGNERKSLAIDGYSKLINFGSSIGGNYIPNRGPGGCWNGDTRDELHSAFDAVSELISSANLVYQLGWPSEVIRKNISNASAEDILGATLEYGVKANEHVRTFARKSNTLFEDFTVETFELGGNPLNSLAISTRDASYKICVFGDTSSHPVYIPQDEHCPTTAHDFGTVEVYLNYDGAQAGILKASCLAENSSEEEDVYFEAYKQVKCLTGKNEALRGVELNVKPAANYNVEIQNGIVPCDFGM